MRKIETEIHIAAAPERVWSAIVDFAHFEWNPMFQSVTGSLAVGARLEIVLRKPRFTIRPRITVLERGRLLEWRGNLGIPGLVDGQHYFELIAADGGTRLRHGETFSGLLVPLLGGPLDRTEKGFAAFNRALKDEVERARA